MFNLFAQDFFVQLINFHPSGRFAQQIPGDFIKGIPFLHHIHPGRRKRVSCLKRFPIGHAGAQRIFSTGQRPIGRRLTAGNISRRHRRGIGSRRGRGAAQMGVSPFQFLPGWNQQLIAHSELFRGNSGAIVLGQRLVIGPCAVKFLGNSPIILSRLNRVGTERRRSGGGIGSSCGGHGRGSVLRAWTYSTHAILRSTAA